MFEHKTQRLGTLNEQIHDVQSIEGNFNNTAFVAVTKVRHSKLRAIVHNTDEYRFSREYLDLALSPNGKTCAHIHLSGWMFDVWLNRAEAVWVIHRESLSDQISDIAWLDDETLVWASENAVYQNGDDVTKKLKFQTFANGEILVEPTDEPAYIICLDGSRRAYTQAILEHASILTNIKGTHAVEYHGAIGPTFDDFEKNPWGENIVYSSDRRRIAYVGKTITNPFAKLINAHVGTSFQVSKSTVVDHSQSRIWKKLYPQAYIAHVTDTHIIAVGHMKTDECVIIDEIEGPTFKSVSNVRYNESTKTLSYLGHKGIDIFRVTVSL